MMSSANAILVNYSWRDPWRNPRNKRWISEKIYERRKERESLRAALRAEIQAILAIVERRDYIAGLSNFVEAIKGGSTNLFEIRIGRDYDIVFRSNCGKLGLLPSETAARTVDFYMIGSGVFTLNVDTETGAVISFQIEKSTGWGILDASCLKTFKQWRFKPHAVAKVQMPVTFYLR